MLTAHSIDIAEAFIRASNCRLQKIQRISEKEISDAFMVARALVNLTENNEYTQNQTSLLVDKILSEEQFPLEIVICLKLICDKEYFKHFQAISECRLSVESYKRLLKRALARLFSFEKVDFDYYLNFLSKSYTNKYQIINLAREKVDIVVPIYIVDAIFNTPYKFDTYERTLLEYNASVKESFDIARKLPEKLFVTACLSENSKSILMWSHYADNHKGFCVEYNFNKEVLGADINVTDALTPVNYTNSIPQLSVNSISQLISMKTDKSYNKNPQITTITTNKVVEAISTKSLEWQYESEWRIIVFRNIGKNLLRLPYVSKIILGVDIDDTNKQKLIDLAKRKGISVYQSYLSPNNYEINYYIIE